MIQFKEITIKDFMSIGEITFTFEERTTLLLGMNLDSTGADDNGSGKSSIADAVRWCLYGETVRSAIDSSLAVEHVVRKGAKTASVTLSLDVDGTPLDITRTRTKSKGTLSVMNGGNPHEGRDAQAVIDQCLGIDVVQFANLVHLDGSYPRLFAPSTDRDRKEILADLVDVAIAENIRQYTCARVNVITDEISEIEHGLGVFQFTISRAEEDKETHRDRGVKFTAELAWAKEKVKETAGTVGRLKIEHDILSQKASKIVKAYSSDHDQLVHDLDAVQGIIDNMRIRLENLNDSYMTDLIHEATKKLNYTEQQVNLRRTRVSEMEQLQTLGKCPTCSQDTTAVGTKEIESLTSQAEELEGEVQKLKDLLETLEQKRAVKLKDARRDLREQEQFERTIRKELNDLHAKETAEAAEVQNKLKAVDKQWRAACSENSEWCAKRNQLLSSIADAKNNWERAKVEIAQATNEIEKLKERHEVLTEQQNDLEFWKKGFGPKGVPSLFIETVLPSISERIQKYANILTGGDVVVKLTAYRETKSKTVQEAIQISAVNSKGASVYGSNSTGERNRINLAVTLGLIDYFKDMGVFESDLLICDEIFDGLDSTGVEQALLALNEANIPSVLVISHHDHFKPLFAHTLYVKKEGGVSSLLQ